MGTHKLTQRLETLRSASFRRVSRPQAAQALILLLMLASSGFGQGIASAGSPPAINTTPYLYASQFTGADPSVQINACITAVIALGGGFCDARSLGGPTPKTMSQQISLGSSALVPVTLLLPDSGTWNWGLTDGVSCGIRQFSGTTILGDRPGGDSGTGVVLDSAAGANMDSLWCTDGTGGTGSGAYTRAEGFRILNDGAGTFANGIAHMVKLWDGAQIQRVFAKNLTGDAWHIDFACCGDNFDHIFGQSAETSGGGYPLVIGGGQGFSISHSTFNNPGITKNTVYINWNGTSQDPPSGISFIDVYAEKSGATDYVTPGVYIGNTAPAGSPVISFFGGWFGYNGCVSNCTQRVFENHSITGIDIQDVGVDNHIVTAINDVAAGRTWNSDGFSIRKYSTANGPSPAGVAKSFIQGLSTDQLYAQATSGPLQHIAGAVTFTPTTIGWYRLIANNGATMSGTVDISTAYHNKVSNLLIDFAVFGYGESSFVTARNGGVYGGSGGVIDQIEASSNGANLQYLDVHVADVTTPGPVSVVFFGLSIPSGYIVQAPVVGATPGATSTAILTIGSDVNFPAINTTNPITTGTACPTGVSAGSVCATAMYVGGVTPSLTPAVHTWGCTIGLGTQFGGFTCAQFVPDTAITIVKMTMFATTAGATCTTAPVLAIEDTSNANAILTSLTFANAVNNYASGTLAVGVTSGHVLQAAISTAGVCVTNPSGVSFLVEYR
jgi:hypothetical protein